MIKSDTQTTLTASASPSTPGQAVTFRATVSATAPGAGTPTGTVAFKIDGNPAGTASLSGGAATITTSSLALGSHAVVATYNGDTRFNGSTSTTLTQPVAQYTIAGFFSPVPGSKWKPGQTVPVKIALTTAQGARTKACSGCTVMFQATKVGTAGQAIGPVSMKYDTGTQQYIYNWKLANKGVGLTDLRVYVTYPNSATLTAKTEQIKIAS